MNTLPLYTENVKYLDGGPCRTFAEFFGVEISVLPAAAEVARAHIPHQRSSALNVEARDASLARVVVKIAQFGGADIKLPGMFEQNSSKKRKNDDNCKKSKMEMYSGPPGSNVLHRETKIDSRK